MIDWSAKKKVREYGTTIFFRYVHTTLRRPSQECHWVEEQEWTQYISRNDTNSNRSKLIIAGKKLINAYDLLVGFCRGVCTIQLKRRFAGLTRQPAGDRLRRGEAGGDSPRPLHTMRQNKKEKGDK